MMSDQAYCKDLLANLVAAPSASLHEHEVAQILWKELSSFGLSPQLVPIEDNACNLSCLLKGNGNGPKLILGGHMDTVQATDGWATNPYHLTEKYGRLYGLGAGDMKGGLAACLTVLRRLVQHGKHFNGEILFLALSDEERYSIGANLWAKTAGKADLAIFAEPHFDNIVIGATGKILLKLTITGCSGHAAHPEEGINAVDCMSRFLCALNDKYRPQYENGKAASCCVLRIESRYKGYSLNIPDHCEALLNKQLLTTENAEHFTSELRNIFDGLHCNGNLTIEQCIPSYPSYQLEMPFEPLTCLLDVAGQFNVKPQLQLNQSVSDGNILFSRLNIPTILFGPQGIDFHKPNEYVVEDTLYKYCDILEKFVLDWMHS